MNEITPGVLEIARKILRDNKPENYYWALSKETLEEMAKNPMPDIENIKQIDKVNENLRKNWKRK